MAAHVTHPRIMFSVAEPSADMLAADLARHLRRRQPALQLFGAGGPKMAAAGVDVRLDVSHTSAFGLWDLAAAMPSHLRSGLGIRRLLARERPDLVVLVDAPGFNLPIARIARRLRVPTVYYVAPQTWLWNPAGAVRRIRHAADLVVAIFEREAEVYRRAGVPAVYFGHPLADLAAEPRRPPAEVRRDLGIDAERLTVGLFPGSRSGEVVRLLRDMVSALELVRARLSVPIEALVAVASPRLRHTIAHVLKDCRSLRLSDRPRDVLQASDISLAASGTVLLEAVALDAPVVMTYRLDRVTHYYAKYVLRVRPGAPFFALPNIVAGEAIVPELVEERATPANMADALIAYLADAEVRRHLHAGYARIRARLGPPGVGERIAARVLEMIAH